MPILNSHDVAMLNLTNMMSKNIETIVSSIELIEKLITSIEGRLDTLEEKEQVE